jgi:hypothetical protein
MGKIVLHKTLATETFIKSLIQRGVLEIKEIVDWESQKMNPQLLTSLMLFVDEEVQSSKYRKQEIDRSELTKAILAAAYDFSESELEYVDKQIIFVRDNNLLRRNVFKKLRKLFVCVLKWLVK